jgi:uncharacterized protein YhaN
MRINRLDLTRYGRFTDAGITFGPAPTDGPDLHIVYGPNESGKTTALTAILDLLFGIEPRSRYNFLHPYPSMRIGAELQTMLGTREFIRLKRPQGSLFDINESPIPDGVILGDLAGINRESYGTMFSLDDDTLEAGGESILASKGDLGQLLFSASSGLADLSSMLRGLKDEAEKFYKSGTRKTGLADLKANLSSLKQERDRVDTLASQFAKLVADRDRATAQYEDAFALRGKTQSRIDEIRRLLSALPRLTALHRIREYLEPLAILPDAPRAWADDLPQLQKSETELETRAKTFRDNIQQLSGEITVIIVDHSAAAMMERVKRLADLHGRHIGADQDIPKLRLPLRETEETISRLLTLIERREEAAPARLLLGATTVGALRKLSQRRSGIETALTTANNELNEARRRCDAAKAQLAASGEDIDDLARPDRQKAIATLGIVLASLRSRDHGARVRLATNTRAAALSTLAERIDQLEPWSGTADTLAAMRPIENTGIGAWKISSDQLKTKIDEKRNDAERFETERLRLLSEIDGIGTTAGVVSDDEAIQVRATRDQAWLEHRRELGGHTADQFEQSLRRDDAVTSARFGHTSDLAKLHEARQQLKIRDSEILRTKELQRDSEIGLQSLKSEIASAIQLMDPSLPSEMPLSQLETWIALRERALEWREKVLQAEQDLDTAQADVSADFSTLLSAIRVAGVGNVEGANFDTLIATAQSTIDRDVELKALRNAIAERTSDLADRQRHAEIAAGNEQAWLTSWTETCSACWLGETGSIPSLEAVNEILSALSELGPALDKKSGLEDRISKMERDQTAFSSEINALADELKIPRTHDSVLDFADAVFRHIQDAASTQALFDQKTETLAKDRESLEEIEEAQKLNTTRKSEMTSLFGVVSLTEVAKALVDLERKVDLEQQEASAWEDILDGLRLRSIDEAEQALEGVDRNELERELAELTARLTDQDQRTRDLFSDRSKASDRIDEVGGDDAVAKIDEQRRTVMLEIEEDAAQYLRLRLGTEAAEHALRVYRDRHRSSMLRRASDAFRTISREAYRGLSTQPEKDSEVLIAVTADGGSKIASALSKGTRFQLYLALRVAGYFEFSLSRPTVPFIADDIMETFDDFRAEEAFRLFAEMANVGQVIYFTHHRHLCDIAQQACPNVRLHQL